MPAEQALIAIRNETSQVGTAVKVDIEGLLTKHLRLLLNIRGTKHLKWEVESLELINLLLHPHLNLPATLKDPSSEESPPKTLGRNSPASPLCPDEAGKITTPTNSSSKHPPRP